MAFIGATNPPKILYSEQLSDAREDYKRPPTTYLWTHYIDRQEREIALPRYAAITSKGGGSKHFAIVCQLDAPIKLENIHFDIGLFSNFEGSDNIAFQQTAPIVRPNSTGHPRKLYTRGFWANLAPPYFAVLSRYRKLSSDETSAISRMMASNKTTVDDFKMLVDALKA